MTTTAANVRVAVTGKIGVGDLTATAPTDSSTDVSSDFPGMGYISEDGVEFTPPGAGDSTPIKAWQNGETVRTIHAPSDDVPTWHFTLIETSLAVVEAYFGVSVTQSATDGSWEYKVKIRDHKSYVLDVVDGSELIRHYIPYGIVTDLGAQTFANSSAVGYEITISGDLDPDKDYNMKGWATALKSTT